MPSCGPGPQEGVCGRQLTDVFLTDRCFSLYFSFPSPLSKSKYIKSLIKKARLELPRKEKKKNKDKTMVSKIQVSD